MCIYQNEDIHVSSRGVFAVFIQECAITCCSFVSRSIYSGSLQLEVYLLFLFKVLVRWQ